MIYHVLIPVLCAVAMNGVIIYEKKTGYIIGIVWTILFALLGYAHYLLYNLKNKMNFGTISIIFFVIFALAYPLMDAKYGHVFNLISLFLSFVVSLIVMMYSKSAFLCMIPLLVWILFINVTHYTFSHLNRPIKQENE